MSAELDESLVIPFLVALLHDNYSLVTMKQELSLEVLDQASAEGLQGIGISPLTGHAVAAYVLAWFWQRIMDVVIVSTLKGQYYYTCFE